GRARSGKTPGANLLFSPNPVARLEPLVAAVAAARHGLDHAAPKRVARLLQGRRSLQAAMAAGVVTCSAASTCATALTTAAMRPTSFSCCVPKPDSRNSLACDWMQNVHLPTIDA